MPGRGFQPLRTVLKSVGLLTVVVCGTVAPCIASPSETPPPVSAAAPAADLPPAPLAGRTVPIGKGATGLALSGDGTRVFVTDNANNTLSEVELLTGKILRVFRDSTPLRTNDGCLDNFCRGIGAVGVALSGDGQSAYVTSMRPDAVSRVDLSSGRSLWSTKVQRFPQHVAVSPDGRQVWLFNLVANSISAVDAKTGAKIGKPIVLERGSARNLPFGRPVGFALSPDGGRLYVSSDLSDSLDVYDLRTRKRVARAAPGSPWKIQFDHSGNQVWAQYSDGLLVFDATTLEARQALRYCRDLKSYSFALSDDGRHVAISLPDEKLALIASRESGLLTHAFHTGDWPLELAFTPDSRHLLSIDSDEQGGMSIFDLDTQMNIDSYLDTAGELFCQPEA